MSNQDRMKAHQVKDVDSGRTLAERLRDLSALEAIVHPNAATYSTGYTYDADGRITHEVITGDITRTTVFTYFPAGHIHAGKISSEAITENGKTVTNTYTYDDVTGKITGVSTTTA